jgi:glucose/arabinose dehydrogenase
MSMRVALVFVALVAQQLPPPFHTPWFRKPTQTVPLPEGHQLTVPQGFAVSTFAEGLQFPRFMALAPNGDVFVAQPVRNQSTIIVLRDADRDGVADVRDMFASDLNRPFGLACIATAPSSHCTDRSIARNSPATVSSASRFATGTRLLHHNLS